MLYDLMCLRPKEIYSYFPSLWSYFYHYIIQKGGDLKGIFIGPESDHWLCMSVTPSLTHSLTHCCLVNLIDVTLACEDDNSNLLRLLLLLMLMMRNVLVVVMKFNLGQDL